MFQSLRSVVQRSNVGRILVRIPLRSAATAADSAPIDPDKREWFSLKDKTVPAKPTIIVFPGQGAQFVGMGAQLLKYGEAKRVFERANEALGFDLLKLCLSGTEKEIQATRICQLAVCVTSLAAVERLKAEHPDAVQNCIATAGFSAGEYAALAFAGVLQFEDAVRIVELRGRAMHACCETAPSGLSTVFIGRNSKLDALLEEARSQAAKKGVRDPVCSVANYLATGAKVIGGHVECLRFVESNHSKFGIARCKPLNVAGAFHTTLMRDAATRLREALEKIKINEPTKVAVYANWNAQPYQSSAAVVRKLSENVFNPVRWEQTVLNMYRYGPHFEEKMELAELPRTFELGPGKQLSALLKMTHPKAFAKGAVAIEV